MPSKDSRSQVPAVSAGEFVALMALMVSLTALAIDAMLPALPAISAELGAQGANAGQHLISYMFAGFCIGQLIYGPLSDSTGRKPAVYAGVGVFVAGCVISLWASDYSTMLVGRVLQGIGGASLRVVTTALIRDQFEGVAMARIMGQIMAVFILVPAVAPSVGQLLLEFFDWRAIFVLLLVQATVSLVWFAVRQPETLEKQARRPLSARAVGRGAAKVVRTRVALGYTITSGLVFGGMIAYLTSAQQIFQQLYRVGAAFPLYFGVLALTIGAASAANAHLVSRLGMRPLAYGALMVICAASLVFYVACVGQQGKPPLWAFMAFMMLVFASIGLLFGNFTALAMAPLGDLAGVGAAVVGFGSTLVSLIVGSTIGQRFDGTVGPLAAGFAAIGVAALLLMTWVERGGASQSSREPGAAALTAGDGES